MVKRLVFLTILLLGFGSGCSALEDAGRAQRARAEAEAERAQAQRLDREALLRSAEAMSMTIAAQATQTANLVAEVKGSAQAWRGLTLVTTTALVGALLVTGVLALAILRAAVNGRRSDHERPPTIYLQAPPPPPAPPALPPAAQQQMLPEERARQRFLRLQQGRGQDCQP